MHLTLTARTSLGQWHGCKCSALCLLDTFRTIHCKTRQRLQKARQPVKGVGHWRPFQEKSLRQGLYTQRLEPQATKPSEQNLIARGLALVYDPTLESNCRTPRLDPALRLAASASFNADMSDMRCPLPPSLCCFAYQDLHIIFPHDDRSALSAGHGRLAVGRANHTGALP
jgi:hypothetical protein